MTFIPSVLSVIDANNSYVGALTNAQVLVLTGTDTTGYNGISVSIDSTETSTPLGMVFSISPDNVTWTTYATNTVYGGVPFVKNYEVTSKFFRISYTADNACTISIQTRLTTSDAAASEDSYTVFDNATEAALDAFGKLRVSEPYTLIDIRFPGQSVGTTAFLQNSLQLSQKTSGTGTYNVTAADSRCILTVSGDQTLINQSRKYCNYQPGKSLLLLASAVLTNAGNPASGFRTRLGYYDDHNGLYFQYTAGTGVSINIQNSVLTTIPQSSWNIDRMDGTGTSRLNLDFSKTQLFVIDMEWLGVGRVRFGFYAYGKIHYCHQQLNINLLVAPYTNGINLPVRHEIIGSAGLASNASMTQICSTVISEGGYNPIGRPWSMPMGSTYVQLSNTTGVETPIFLLRGGGSNYNHQSIFPTAITMITNQASDLILYRTRIYRDSIPFTVSAWTNVDTTSITQYALGSTVTGFTGNGSTIVDSGYFYGKNTTAYNLTDIFTSIFQITANADNVSDVILITAENVVGTNTRVYCAVNWHEVF